jgi:phosphoribosylanthranilate isomerase
MKLKICGMKYQDNINQVAKLQPDYLGFIFYEKSPRFFEGDIPQVPNTIKKVGVFVNASIEYIIEQIKTHNIQAIQLHGNESPEFCDALRRAELVSASHNENLKQTQVDIIKVFSIKEKFNFDVLKPYENACDYYLFDTKGKLPGGNGYTFNWNVLNNYPSTKPYFLSGGIGLDQIENINQFQKSKASKYCYAIDVNSKFEIEAGLKDIKRLNRFINQINAKH